MIEVVSEEHSWLYTPEYQILDRTIITDAADPKKTFDVSTVWLGIDMSYGFGGPPIIFETMVFGEGSHDEDCVRCATEAQAREGHTEMVIVVAAEMTDPIVMDALTGRQWNSEDGCGEFEKLLDEARENLPPEIADELRDDE